MHGFLRLVFITRLHCDMWCTGFCRSGVRVSLGVPGPRLVSSKMRRINLECPLCVPVSEFTSIIFSALRIQACCHVKIMQGPCAPKSDFCTSGIRQYLYISLPWQRFTGLLGCQYPGLVYQGLLKYTMHSASPTRLEQTDCREPAFLFSGKRTPILHINSRIHLPIYNIGFIPYFRS